MYGNGIGETKMITVAETFGVDAGVIAVADLDMYVANGGRDCEQPSTRVIDIKPGRYNVKYDIPGWRKAKGNLKLTVTSGKVAIGDPCYFFPIPAWDEFLDKTAFLRRKFKRFKAIDTGGDGSFDSTFVFTKIGE